MSRNQSRMDRHNAMRRIETEADVRSGVEELCRIEPRFSFVIEKAGQPPLRRRAGGFEGLAGIIVSQQVSVASASAIWNRLTAIVKPLDAATMGRASDDDLRLAGLSRPKQRTLRAVCAAIAEGGLDLDALEHASAEDVHAALTAVSGIGPWTADVYLMFCLGHGDAFAAGDLALQEAARLLFGLQDRPNSSDLLTLSEGWRPWRSIAARLLWAHYKVVKAREGVAA